MSINPHYKLHSLTKKKLSAMACTIDCGLFCCYPTRVAEVIKTTSTFASYFSLAVIFFLIIAAGFSLISHTINFVNNTINMTREVEELSRRLRRLERLEEIVVRLNQSSINARGVLDKLVTREREREREEVEGRYIDGTAPYEVRPWYAGSELSLGDGGYSTESQENEVYGDENDVNYVNRNGYRDAEESDEGN
ncbi:hypothetical protein TWF718_007573 [Orbilia javanica]|uniref:Uncharacterized protein n=1 Tax=Orbilia javanica TaxID=47235 RepID=A0AAN8MPI1_9PEZI